MPGTKRPQAKARPTKRKLTPALRVRAEVRKLNSVLLGDIQAHVVKEVAKDKVGRQPEIDRFFKFIEVTADGCWEWTSSRDGSGYGMFWLDGQSTRAHRVMVFWLTGHWPKDKVLHTCDNPPCCNPSHLAEGTHADNMADMVSKGRGRTSPGRDGSGNPAAKLTEADVVEIRAKYASGEYLQQKIADDYGISRTTVSNIVNGKAWSHADTR